MFDIILPISLFTILILVIFLNQKLEKKIKSVFGEETKLGKREVVLLVLLMGIMITIIALMPSRAIQVFYISVFSYNLFSFTYLILKKWYIAILPPIIFISLYFFYWNILTFNIFAFSLASIIIIYTSFLFSWKTTLIFAVLLTLLDVFQVFITGFMGQLAEKAVFELSLPVVIMIPTYPMEGKILLGLGDVFLSGLLSLQNVSKQGRGSGIVTALTISAAMFLYEIFEFNTGFFTYFPATIIVLLGWLAGMKLYKLISKNSNEEDQATKNNKVD